MANAQSPAQLAMNARTVATVASMTILR